jgi:hypothetical protein
MIYDKITISSVDCGLVVCDAFILVGGYQNFGGMQHFYPEDHNTFLQNVGNHLQEYML